MLLAGTVVVDASTIIEEGAVVVDGDRIVAAGAHADLTDRYPNRERCELGVVALGLVDGHVHSAQSFGRGIADDTELLDRLFDHALPVEAGLNAEGMCVVAEPGYLECTESGTTMAVDHPSVRHAEEAFEAASGMGTHGRIGKVFMGTNAPEELWEDTDAGLAESGRPIECYYDSFDGRIQCAVMPWFAVTCSGACLRGARDLADRYDGVRIHTHVSKNRGEIRTVEDKTGMCNTHWLDETGLTGDDVVLAYCVYTDDFERDVLAETGTHVTYCLSSNMKLASGIAPVPDYLDHGINVVFGNDGPSCNNTLDPSTEMRQTSLLQKADALDPTSTPTAAVFEMATRNGAEAAGFDRVGEPRKGWKADIVGVDADRTRVMPLHDVLSHLVFTARGDDVVFTMVDGDALYDEGEHVRADADGIRKRARAIADGLDSAPTSDWTTSPPVRPPHTRNRPATPARPAAIVASFPLRGAIWAMIARSCATTPSDLSAIREIYAPFVENTAISFAYDPSSVANLETKLEQKIDYPWLVCELDGEVAGYAYAGAIRERIVYRWAVEISIYVRPEFQRRGIARGLYTAPLDLFERQGHILAVAVITMPNPVSIVLHESFDFECVGRFERAGCKGDAWYDVEWWSLDSDDRPDDPDAPLSVADVRDRDWWDDVFTRGAALAGSSA